MIEREPLVGYAANFVSFILNSPIGKDVKRVILFGSVARGDFEKDSDIDIFIDTEKEIEKEVNNVLRIYLESKANETWLLKGIKNEISIKVGNLKKWSLRRDVISSGIILYGKFNEKVEKVNYYLLVKIDTSKFSYAKQMRIWRKLYGYKQKVGEKTYVGKGLVAKLGGEKLGKAIFIIPMENRKELIDYLNKDKINYKVNEIWSDTF